MICINISMANCGKETNELFKNELEECLIDLDELTIKERSLTEGVICAAAFDWSIVVETLTVSLVELLVKAIIQAMSSIINKLKEEKDKNCTLRQAISIYICGSLVTVFIDSESFNSVELEKQLLEELREIASIQE